MDAGRETDGGPPVALFFLVFLPFGLATGFVGGTLGFLLARAGVSTVTIGALLGLTYLPQILKFLWAPLVDGSLTNKLWYVGSAVAVGLGILVLSIAPKTAAALPLLDGLVLAGSVASSLVGMTADSLLAHTVSPARKGRAGGWAQAGNVGGTGLGGGGGIWLVAHLGQPWMSGAVMGLVIVACSACLLFIPEPETSHRGGGVVDTGRAIAKDVWALIASRNGLLVILLFMLPLSTAAASNLFTVVAGEWRVGADLLALLAGAGGALAAAGAVGGGYLVDMMDRKAAYALAGGLLAICALAMALAPRTPLMFVGFTGLYTVLSGLAYASYFGVTLEAIGRGAAATKCNLLAGLSNVPIAYMTVVDGAVQTRFGSGAMLTAEAVLGLAAIGAFYLVVQATARWRGPVAAAPL